MAFVLARVRALRAYPKSRRGARQNIVFVDSRTRPRERNMILLATKVLTIETVAALATGFGLGAVIPTADRVRKEAILNALLSTFESKQVAR